MTLTVASGDATPATVMAAPGAKEEETTTSSAGDVTCNFKPDVWGKRVGAGVAAVVGLAKDVAVGAGEAVVACGLAAAVGDGARLGVTDGDTVASRVVAGAGVTVAGLPPHAIKMAIKASVGQAHILPITRTVISCCRLKPCQAKTANVRPPESLTRVRWLAAGLSHPQV